MMVVVMVVQLLLLSLSLSNCLQNLGPAIGEYLHVHSGGERQQGAFPLRGEQRDVTDAAQGGS